jgi:hypothetical protein
MNHIILLGDSILDNAAYTGGRPAVIDHLQEQLDTGWKASLLAIDGSVTTDVPSQLAKLPADATHLVVSAGGNDALMQSSFVSQPAQSVADVLLRMTAIARQFEQQYQSMLGAVLARGLPTILCTIYEPNFPDPSIQQLMSAGLLVFNDTMLRIAFRKGLPMIDLRLVCTTPADYANEIEPSVAGGQKIAGAIVRAATQHDFHQQRTTIYY